MPLPVQATPPRMTVTSLTCERRDTPLGIDAPAPRLGWVLKASGNGRCQSAYQIIVGTSPSADNLWDSGQIKSGESTDVPYAGRQLASSERAYWRARVWDEHGVPSDWSSTTSWTAGIMHPQDWRAKWICASPEVSASSDSTLLRREFVVRPGLKRSIVHITGLGQYEMQLNGKKVGDQLLSPGWTDYRKTVLYDTFDITKLLRPGANAVGILLGNGMDNVHGPRYSKFTGSFGPQKAIGQIQLMYEDGSNETVITDKNWTSHPGPITFSSVYGGEDYDYRRVPKGWDRPGFSEVWAPAVETEGPGGDLRGAAFAAPPLHTFETLKPQRVYPIRDGVETIDLGQNASLMVRLKASGPKGSTVRIIPSEIIKPDGTLDRTSTGVGDAWWQITLDGQKVTYFPKFFYHGCRYLQVERSGGAKVEEIEGVVVHSAAQQVGEFSCSSELFNRIHTLVRWAQRSNLVSVITDCPRRERLGWLEQYHLNGPSLRYEHDLWSLYTKTMQDMADSQLPNGLVPDISPEYAVFGGPFRDSPEWGSAVILVPWQQYLFHRDLSLLRDRYETMKRYQAYLRSTATEYIVSHGLGDWYDIGPGEPGPSKNTPMPLTATAFYFEDTKVLGQAARLLGKVDDAAAFEEAGAAIRSAFNRKFFDPVRGSYATDSQTSNALPLVTGLVEPEHRESVLDHLVRDIESRGNAVTAGDVGFRYVLRALADGGRSDLVFAMNNQSEKPGYGYQLNMGATSLTEAWDANPTSSQNHFMLGQIVEWLYHDLCGIQPMDGFKHFRIQPCPVAGLEWAQASYRSEYGLIKSRWQRTGSAITYKIEVPPNSAAEVKLPGSAVHSMGSGSYSFTVPEK